MNITLIHVLAAVIWLAMSVEGLLCYTGSAALEIPEKLTTCAAGEDSCVTMQLTQSGIHYQARTCATKAQCNAFDFKNQMKQYILGKLPTFIGTVDSTSCCQGLGCNYEKIIFCKNGSASLGIPEEYKKCAMGQDSCVTMQLTQSGIHYVATTCATKAQCDALDFKDQMKQYILGKLPTFVGTVDSTSCCQKDLCNIAQSIFCQTGSPGLGISREIQKCATGQDSCVTIELTQSGIRYLARTCATKAQCSALDFKDQMKQYILGKLPTFVGTVDSTSCCQTSLCNNANDGLTCRFGSSGLGVPEVDKACASGEDSCVTAVLSQGGQQLIGRGCATTAQCAAADFKEQLKQYIGSLVSSFTGTVESYTCCQYDLCNNVGGSGSGTTSGGGNGCARLRAARFTSVLLVAATVISSAF